LTVELDLLNLPRDLSTNLNEDSDNQKENVVPNKRFRMVIDEETDVFLRGKLESGSYSVPSFLSTPRKNLAIIL
jgi:hypothetical protein